MPGTSNFPGALDTFPDLAPSSQENLVSHSGVHNNEAASISALQAKVGIDDSAETDSLDFRVGAAENALLGKSDVGHTHTADEVTQVRRLCDSFGDVLCDQNYNRLVMVY